MRAFPAAVLFCFAGAALSAQEAPPAFEVVSVKPSPPPDHDKGIRVGCSGGPGSSDPGMMRCTNYSMSNLLSRAYNVRHYQINGPSWIDSEMYEIVAKVPAGATKEQVNVMFQTMLADRFHLVLHHEQKEVPSYDLVVAKGGPKMKPWVEPPPAPPAEPDVKPAAPDSFPKFTMGKDGFPELPKGSGATMIMMNGKARRSGTETMEDFVKWLSGQSGRPVSDGTNLKGKFDTTIYWAESSGRATPVDGSASAPDDSGPTLFGAIQEQLGLRLESKKGPVDMIVVDKVDKAPIEN